MRCRTLGRTPVKLGAVAIPPRAAHIDALDAASATPPGYAHALPADPCNRDRLADGQPDHLDVSPLPVR